MTIPFGWLDPKIPREEFQRKVSGFRRFFEFCVITVTFLGAMSAVILAALLIS